MKDQNCDLSRARLFSDLRYSPDLVDDYVFLNVGGGMVCISLHVQAKNALDALFNWKPV